MRCVKSIPVYGVIFLPHCPKVPRSFSNTTRRPGSRPWRFSFVNFFATQRVSLDWSSRVFSCWVGSCSLKKKWTIVSNKMNQCFKKSNHWRKKHQSLKEGENKRYRKEFKRRDECRAQSICQWSVAVTWVGLISPSATKDCPAMPWCWFRRSRRCYMFGKKQTEYISDQLYLYLKLYLKLYFWSGTKICIGKNMEQTWKLLHMVHSPASHFAVVQTRKQREVERS